MNEKDVINWVVFDAEANGLHPDKFYCVSYEDHLGESKTLTEYDEIREFFTKYDYYVGHNIRRWDLPHLERVVEIDVAGKVIDTLAIAWYLDPKRKKNGLDDFAPELGLEKPKIHSWHNQELKDYIHRCEQDVKINIALWRQQYTHLFEIYEDRSEVFRFLGYLDFKMRSAALAEESGWKLDLDLCESELDRLSTLKEEKFSELQAAMPKVPVYKTFKKPKVFKKADGSISALGQVWIERLRDLGLPEDYEEEVEEISGYNEPNPNSHQQIKNWLYDLGWKPQTFKYVRDKTSGEIKEIPQVNKTKQEGGGVCESVQKLYEKEPSLELLDGYSILSHRISILNGFLKNVDEDGYLVAAVSGLTNTLRFKHTVIVNLPKIDTPYSENLRRCLIAPDDTQELCGSDMAGIEDRLKQHYLYPYDPDYVAQLQDEDYDAHLDIAVLGGLMTESEAEQYKSGTGAPKLKTIRGIAKNANYACQYGAGASRIAITAGIGMDEAKQLHKTYWEKNWAIKACAEDQVVKTVNDQKWLYNPISGFWYSLRTEKDRFSTLVQGSAVYCFDIWVSHVLADRPQITGQFHDEIILTVDKGHAYFDEETHKYYGPLVDWLKECIAQTNDFLELNVLLDIDVQVGDNYADIH